MKAKDNPSPTLVRWTQYAVAGAIHFFADKHGIARKCKREIAEHTDLNELTVHRQLNEMITNGSVEVVEEDTTTFRWGQRSARVTGFIPI